MRNVYERVVQTAYFVVYIVSASYTTCHVTVQQVWRGISDAGSEIPTAVGVVIGRTYVVACNSDRTLVKGGSKCLAGLSEGYEE
jgi:hypothetical protein